jgi:hypothetical protein
MVEKRKRFTVSQNNNGGKISESVHQVSFVNWFRATYPGVLIFAIPNGGARNPRVAEKLKFEGVVRGIPDLYVPAGKLWIEMKTEKGRLSDFQKEMIVYLYSIGDNVIIGYGFEDAKQKTKEVMG